MQQEIEAKRKHELSDQKHERLLEDSRREMEDCSTANLKLKEDKVSISRTTML